ncbi:MAG: hypothetical protein ACSLE3_04265 [Microbacteriaceae bacterium]|jgi:hypothetical protein
MTEDPGRSPDDDDTSDEREWLPNRRPLIWLAALLGVAVLSLSIILPLLLVTRG